MPDLCEPADRGGTSGSKERVAALAARQSGIVARRQLVLLGVSDRQIGGWARGAYLHRRLPGVYAVGHTAPSFEADLTAALLYAGPGAMLSHGTAAWWLGLTNRVPSVIHVSTPRQAVSPPGILVHGRRNLERTWHRALPIPSLPEVLLDYATTASDDDIRYVLAQAEYHGYLDLSDVRLRHGRPGSAKLRQALGRHQPQLAHTRSEFERRMLYLCEDHGIPIPEFNAWLHGHLVDAVWLEQRVVVECDGEDAHSTWAQIQADHDRDLALRAAGFTVLRYTWPQITKHPDRVAADIQRALLD